jgi:hypothetical protein
VYKARNKNNRWLEAILHQLAGVGILMKEWRRQQIPMTLKAHVMEHHVIETNRKLKGMGDKDESFVEKLHQDGIRDDRRMACVPSFEKKHRSIMLFSAIANNGNVTNIIADIQRKSKRFFNTDRCRFKNAKFKVKEERKIKREAFVAGEAVLDLSAANEIEDDDGPDNVLSQQDI